MSNHGYRRTRWWVSGLVLALGLVGLLPGVAGAAIDPRGHLDAIHPNGVVAGWACDPDDDFSRPYIRLLVDGRDAAGAGQRHPREQAVNVACGKGGYHGFTGYLPAWALDGRPHELRVLVQNRPSESPVRYVEIARRSFAATNRPPTGTLQGASGGRIWGTASDPDRPGASTRVALTLTRSPESVYEQPHPSDGRAIVNTDAAGRWFYTVPAQYRDATYSVIARALDVDGNLVLSQRLVNGLAPIR